MWANLKQSGEDRRRVIFGHDTGSCGTRSPHNRMLISLTPRCSPWRSGCKAGHSVRAPLIVWVTFVVQLVGTSGGCSTFPTRKTD